MMIEKNNISEKIILDQLTVKKLENIIFLLIDAIGGKNLKWRKRRKQYSIYSYRSLGANFYIGGPFGELISQKWIIEIKDDKFPFKDYISNATKESHLDVIVIASNSEFSNDLINWNKEWKKLNKTPKVLLWDKNTLKQMISKYPHIIARLKKKKVFHSDK